MIPQSLGYARIAGVPVEVGLYAVPLSLLAYAILGSSPQLIVGPASTVAIVSGSLVADIASDNPEDAVAITAALAISAGIVLIATGLLRIAWVAEFLSKPIVTGFVFGLTLAIVVGELPTLLGISKPQGNLVETLVRTIAKIGEADPRTALVGGLALAILMGGRRISPTVPWGLVTLVVAVGASKLLGLESEGVATIGEVPAGLPPLGLPIIPREDLGAVVVGGASLALVAMAEGLAATRLFATRGGYRVETEYELVGMGASNIGAGLSGGLGVAGSLSKTAAADHAGSRSQVTGLSAAGLVVVVLLAFTWVFTDLPQAVLSAIVVAAVWGLMDVAALRRFREIRQADFVAAMVGIGGVVLFGPLPGLGIAIVTSLLAIIYRSSSPRMEVLGKISAEKAAWGRMRGHKTRKVVPGIVVIRLDAPLFWANATAIEDRLLREMENWPDTRALVLDLEATSQIESTSADMLGHLHEELAGRGIALYLARVINPVSSVLDRSGFLATLGEDHIWHSISQCVRAARKATGLKGVARVEAAPVETAAEPIGEVARAEAAPVETAAVEPISEVARVDQYEPVVVGDSEAEVFQVDEDDPVTTLDSPVIEVLNESEIELLEDSEDDEIEVVDDEDPEEDAIYSGKSRADAIRDNAIDFYLGVYNYGQPREAVAALVGEQLIQHSTGIRDGADGFVEYGERFVDLYQQRSVRVVRSISDPPYVFLHGLQSLNDGRSERVTADFYAFDDDDSIIEQWGVVAPHTRERGSWRSVTDGTTDIRDVADTDKNKKLVRSMIKDTLIHRRKKPGKIDRYLDSNLMDHTASFAAGRIALREAARSDGPLSYDEIVLVVGEGNFVATLCKAKRAGTRVAQVDIFRIENGLIVEHWDNTELVPPNKELVNSGKF
jgi:high affinity sulfate transporter 1